MSSVAERGHDTALNVCDVIESVDRKVHVLEECTFALLPSGMKPPELIHVREYANMRAMYNAIDSSLLRLEKVLTALPRAAVEGRSHIQAARIDYDPGQRFFELLAPHLHALTVAGESIGGLQKEFGNTATVVYHQVKLLNESCSAEAELITRASTMAKPQNPEKFKVVCEKLVDASSELSELKYEADLRSRLHNHVMALADTAALLGWVVAPASLKHVRDYKNIVTNLTESILASYIDLGCNGVHSDFAEALNAVVDTVAKYVADDHPAGLRWNYGAGATPLGYRRAERKVDPNAHPFGDFYNMIHGSVTRYVLCSQYFGSYVKKQAEGVSAAFEELAKVVEKASDKPIPVGSGEGELRLLLMSLHHELTPLDELLKQVPEDYKYRNHVDVIAEFTSILQWCTASVNKMSPVTYIVDLRGVLSTSLDRIVIGHAGPESAGEAFLPQIHRQWAQAVRDMISDMHDYVKTHHPNGLSFDSRRTRRSMDDINRRLSLTTQLKECRAKSTAQKWTKQTVSRRVRGVVRLVSVWQRLSH